VPCHNADAMPDAAEPLISVVICAYDRHDLLRQTIDSVQDQTLAPDRYEIIVVDNSPDQAAAARFGERYRDRPRLRYLLEATPGASNARNVGAAAGRGRRVAFIDDDIVASPGWLGAMLDAFATFPDAGVVGGCVRARWTSARPGWLHDRLLSYVSVIDWGGALRIAERHEWLGSGNMAVARDDFLAVGGFSVALGRVGSGAMLLSNEDADLTGRIASRRRAVVYAPDAVVEHVIDPARLTQSWFRRRAAWQAVSDFLATPASAAARAADAAARMRLIAQLRRGTIPGFFTDTDDPAGFFEQVQTAYHLTMALLGGGVDVDPAWIERMSGPPAIAPRAAGSDTNERAK